MQDELVFRIDGSVTLDDFQTALSGFVQTLNALSSEEAPNTNILWVIDELKGGSAVVKARPQAIVGTLPPLIVGAIENRMVKAVSDARRGTILHYSTRIQNGLSRMASVINGRIPQISVSTSKRTAAVNARLVEPEKETQSGKPSVGAITGQVVTMSKKNRSIFSIQLPHDGEVVNCFTDREIVNKLGEYWGEGIWVEVTGSISRDERHVPKTVTQVSKIELVESANWEDALGCAPRKPGDKTSSAEAIRKIRDE